MAFVPFVIVCHRRAWPKVESNTHQGDYDKGYVSENSCRYHDYRSPFLRVHFLFQALRIVFEAMALD